MSEYKPEEHTAQAKRALNRLLLTEKQAAEQDRLEQKELSLSRNEETSVMNMRTERVQGVTPLFIEPMKDSSDLITDEYRQTLQENNIQC